MDILTPARNNPYGTITSRRNQCYGFAVIAYLEQNFLTVNTLLMTIRNQIIKLVDPERTPENCPRKLPYFIKTKSLHASFYGSTPYLQQSDYHHFFQGKTGGLDNGAVLNSVAEKLSHYLSEQEPTLVPVGLEFKEEDGTILARYRVKTKDDDQRPLATLKRLLDVGQIAPIWDPNPLRDTTVAIVLCVAAVKESPELIQSIKTVLGVANEGFMALEEQSINNYTIIKEYDKRTLTRGKHVDIFTEVYKNQTTAPSFV